MSCNDRFSDRGQENRDTRSQATTVSSPRERIVARIEDGELIFEKAETIKQRLKQRFAHLQGQGLVEDLITERRLTAEEEG